MMALDAKIIKEEILEKDSYDTTTSNTSSSRKLKGKECRPPDSPEGAVAPHSPMCPQINLSTIVPQTQRNSINTSRNEGASPVNSITPPPSISEGARLLKIRRFLGALVQFGQDNNPDVGDRIRSLVLSLASGGLSVEDFQIAVQEATNFPLRPNILPFLKSHVPSLQRDISVASRATKQTPIQFVRSNESAVLEFVHNPTEHSEFFFHDGSFNTPAVNAGTSSTAPLLAKRRASDVYENANGNTGGAAAYDWDYLLPPSKRASVHSMFLTSSAAGANSAAAAAAAAAAAQHLYAGHPSFLEYQNGLQTSHSELLHTNNHRDDRDLRSASVAAASNEAHRTSLGRDEEWKNIHTMLTCISAMVEKTKRAISILQNRGIEPHASSSAAQEAPLADIKRQTEEKIAEFRRNAEDAVNQVKRQAVIEIQRAVTAAESRAVEMIAQERVKMEKIFADINRSSTDLTAEPVIEPSQVQTTQNACWNCGRKANETCSGCNLARYCGSFCQHKDWEQHHQVCGQSRSDQTKAQNSSRATLVPARTSPPTQMTSNNSVNNVK